MTITGPDQIWLQDNLTSQKKPCFELHSLVAYSVSWPTMKERILQGLKKFCLLTLPAPEVVGLNVKHPPHFSLQASYSPYSWSNWSHSGMSDGGAMSKTWHPEIVGSDTMSLTNGSGNPILGQSDTRGGRREPNKETFPLASPAYNTPKS